MKLPAIFRRLRSVPTERRAVSLGPMLSLFDATGLDLTTLGKRVNPESALTASGVWAAVSIISSAIATLPVHIIDRTRRERDDAHPLNDLIARPNPDMTWPDLIESLVLNLLTHGNAYAWAERDVSTARPRTLWPMRSARVLVRRGDRGLEYVSLNLNEPSPPLPADEVIHVRNFGWDGLYGISPLTAGANAVGLTLALDEFASKFFTNGAHVPTVLELPPMGDDALAEFKRRWRSEYAGLDNAHKTAAAPGLKAHRLGVSPREAQAEEARKFQLLEIARIYQVPPHMLGDLGGATFNNVEEQRREFAEQTLRRWTVKLEHALESRLLLTQERRRYSIRFNVAARIRGTFRDQVEAIMQATGGAPIYTQNEGRDYLGLPPVQGGDRLMSNLNQAPADSRDTDTAVDSSITTPEKPHPAVQVVARNLATQQANALERAGRKHEDAEDFRAWAANFYTHLADKMLESRVGDDTYDTKLRNYTSAQLERAVEAHRDGQLTTHADAIRRNGADEIIALITPTAEADA